MNKQGAFQLHKHISRGEQIISVLLFAGFFLFAAYGLYDMQKAQGVDLYLSLQVGQMHSFFGDALSCGIFLLPFLLLLLLPCLCMGRKDAFSLLRLEALYLTFIPVISPAYLIHLPAIAHPFALREALVQGEWQSLFTEFALLLLPYLRTALPLLCILLALQAYKKASLPRWVKMLFLIQILLFIIGFLFSNLTPLSEYLIWYFFVLILYRLWVDTPGEVSALHGANWLFTLFLLLVGCYRLLTLLSSFSLR